MKRLRTSHCIHPTLEHIVSSTPNEDAECAEIFAKFSSHGMSLMGWTAAYSYMERQISRESGTPKP